MWGKSLEELSSGKSLAMEWALRLIHRGFEAQNYLPSSQECRVLIAAIKTIFLYQSSNLRFKLYNETLNTMSDRIIYEWVAEWHFIKMTPLSKT